MRRSKFHRYVDAQFSTLQERAAELLHCRRAERRFKFRRQRQSAQAIVADFVAGTQSLNIETRATQLSRMTGKPLTEEERQALVQKVAAAKKRRQDAAKSRSIKIVFFGAGTFRPAIRGHTAVPRKAVVRRLAALGIVVVIDEFHTSQYCTCQTHKLETVNTPQASQAGARQRRHADASAPCSCLKVFGDRDALAAINILVCGLHALWGAPRPEPFRRTTA